MTTNVVFNRQTGPYRTGEAAGFDDTVAQKLMAQGAARLLTEQPEPDPRPFPGFSTGPRLPPAHASAMEMVAAVQQQEAGATVAAQPPQEAAAATPRKGGGSRLGDAARGAGA